MAKQYVLDWLVMGIFVGSLGGSFLCVTNGHSRIDSWVVRSFPMPMSDFPFLMSFFPLGFYFMIPSRHQLLI